MDHIILAPIQVRVFRRGYDVFNLHPVPARDDRMVRCCVKLVDEVRWHIIRPGSSTTTLYRAILQRVYAGLHPRDQRRGAVPSEAAIREFVQRTFPMIILANDQLEPRNWGTVVVGVRDRLTLWRGPWEAFYEADRGNHPTLTRYQAGHVLVTTLLHELSYLLGQFFLGPIVTPEGVGPMEVDRDGKTNGESGWEVERIILGGRLSVEWFAENFWDMEFAERLLFTSGHNAVTYDISTGIMGQRVSKAFIDSLRTTSLAIPEPVRLGCIVHVDGPQFARARVGAALADQSFDSMESSSLFRTPRRYRIAVAVGGDITGINPDPRRERW
ncbi:hypothetical protein P7C73_g1591, partial [Tremellales sp. Uapishka_1]